MDLDTLVKTASESQAVQEGITLFNAVVGTVAGGAGIATGVGQYVAGDRLDGITMATLSLYFFGRGVANALEYRGQRRSTRK